MIEQRLLPDPLPVEREALDNLMRSIALRQWAPKRIKTWISGWLVEVSKIQGVSGSSRVVYVTGSREFRVPYLGQNPPWVCIEPMSSWSDCHGLKFGYSSTVDTLVVFVDSTCGKLLEGLTRSS